MKKTILKMGIAGMAALSLGSCQKDPLNDLTAEESRIYITNYDSTADFSSFSTFSIADSVGIIEDNQGRGKQLTSYDAGVIEAVKSAMQQRGFLLVDRSSSPDLGINVSRVYSNYTGLVSYPAYWGGYGGFYDPFYWGYGGFGYYDPLFYGPQFYDVYQVTEGALTVDILNLKDAEKNNNTIRPVWSAVARGSGVFNSAVSGEQVEAFFQQSPYLRVRQ